GGRADERGGGGQVDQNAAEARSVPALPREQPARLDHDAVAPLVVADADRPDVPRRLERLEQHEVVRRLDAVALEPREEAGQVLGQRAHLLLLDVGGHGPPRRARREVEDALPGRADGAGGEVIGRLEVEGRVHDLPPPSQARSPSTELTVSTDGPWGR